MAKAEPAPVLILGSASPRRADLLRQLGVEFVVEPIDIDEQALVATSDIVATVTRIAEAKFAAFADRGDRRLLTADTLVACNGVLFAKPGSDDDVASMLRAMSGQTLTIATAVCVGHVGSQPTTEVVTTRVDLRDLETSEIARYVATGVGLDKAAGLALQAEAGDFIAAVDGCWSNVLGLPLCAVAAALELEVSDDRQVWSAGERTFCSVELCGGS